MSDVFFVDRFDDDRPAGKVIGTQGAAGVIRKGVDREKIIGIDNGALRIEPLFQNGWARCGLVYGPYRRQNGLALAISLTNGHNTSQADSLNQPFRRRMVDWVLGERSLPPSRRIIKWLRNGRKRRTFRLWRRWWAIHSQLANKQYEQLDENLALGWFPEEVPEDPRLVGNAFIVHATGKENGELWARIDEKTPPLIRGLQNVPLFYFVILREHGAAYYAAAVPETSYLPAYPQMRPLGIDVTGSESEVYAGLYQGVMGQSGFRADTRVREIQINRIPELTSWYGTAQAADRLVGNGPLAGSQSDTGQVWQGVRGQFQRTAQGCQSAEPDNLTTLDVISPAGLIHLIVHIGAEIPRSLSLIWRLQDKDNYWLWELGKEGHQLCLVLRGEKTIVASDAQAILACNSTQSLQVLDDGQQVRLLVDGKPVCGTANVADHFQHATGVGIGSSGAADDFFFNSLEMHPRIIDVPEMLNFKPLWKHSEERAVIVRDDFCGQAGRLDDRIIPVGGHTWRRELGRGIIELTGQGAAVVKASITQPNPGRTIYAIPWENTGFADLELEFVPPGHGPSAEEKSRIGLAFIQDEDNYITVSTYLDLHYGGSSFAFFYHLKGYEEIYDAIWSNIGRTITWRVATRARVIMDGVNMAVLLNGEAVLYRSLTDVYPDVHDFTIRRVGIVINWEWGDDTGTQLNEFVASDRA